MKVEGIFSTQCVTGVHKNLGNGQVLWQILGEQQEIFQIIGNLSQEFWINKLDYKNMQEKEDGMILICLKLVMVG